MITLQNLPDTACLFLTRQNAKIKRGEYNKFLTIPFASQELLFSVMYNTVKEKIEKHENPLLTEHEIMNCIDDTLYTAACIFKTYVKSGIIIKKDDEYVVSEHIKKYLKNLYKR